MKQLRRSSNLRNREDVSWRVLSTRGWLDMSDNPVRGLIVPFKKGQNQWSKRGIGVKIDMSWGWLPCLHSKEAFVLHTAPVWGRIALQIKMRGRYGIGRFLSCQFCLLQIWDEINENLVLVIHLFSVISKINYHW